MRVVVDTNIAFSALAAGCGDLAVRLLSPAETVFYAPRFLFVELFKHQARILAATRLPEEKLLEALNETHRVAPAHRSRQHPGRRLDAGPPALRRCGLERHTFRRPDLAPRGAALD